MSRMRRRENITTYRGLNTVLFIVVLCIQMHGEIFHFEIFKNFVKFLKYFKTPSLKYFMKFLIFIIKSLKTFRKMIKVYEVSRKYIMLSMHNNRYLHLTGLLTYFVLPEKTS